MTLTMPLIATLATASVIVDRWIGEPRTAHPLVAFGKLAAAIETRLNTGVRARLMGIVAWLLAVASSGAIVSWLVAVLPFLYACALHVALLWFSLC
mgnify:FL=1